MFVEFVALVPMACVMLACALGRALAVRGRAAGRQALTGTAGTLPEGPLDRPSITSVSADLIADLPLVAPAGAGYGTAGRFLVLAATERRGHTTGTSSGQVPGQRRGQETSERSQAA
ncbi:hypothetical protein [Kineosporia sp. NBRC 101731]|uniref:hypothetical protein n=1 Tax=Kineosporia sp. NBRC 101731 TaxID=3032199 RepID=UPI0024A225BB|nr:hypothetical protein [Kineosporia sp. NBRC 101731]GLY31757.1 hypothetical protein Kisp02_51220 [Kineosporia sp. NBRC 101731]